ncbi:MAG: hypothetical protein RL095_1686 [Verrucomicrobiota bacterium]|jgi:signal transduction histidine kinase/BarA-like signal transduction histidine kinase
MSARFRSLSIKFLFFVLLPAFSLWLLASLLFAHFARTRLLEFSSQSLQQQTLAPLAQHADSSLRQVLNVARRSGAQFQQRLNAQPTPGWQQELAAALETRPDGSRRSRGAPAAADNSYPYKFIRKGHQAQEDELLGLWIADSFGRHYHQGVNHLVMDSYFATPHCISTIGAEDWPEQMPPEQRFDRSPEEFPWFAVSMPANNPGGETLFTPVYHDQILQKWMISAISPLRGRDGRYLGLVGHDFPLTSVIAITKSQLRYRDCALFFTTADQQVIATSEGRLRLGLPGLGDNSKILVSQIPSSELREALAGALPDRTSQHLVINGRRKLLIRSTVPSVDWQLNLLLDEDELLAYNQLFGFSLLVISLLGFLLLSLLLFLGLRRMVLRRISGLDAAILSVQHGQSYQPLASGELDELGRVIMNFNSMNANRLLLEKELVEARDKAEAALAAKSQFLANISHELRTPLNSVIGFSEILRENPADPAAPEQLDLIASSGRQLLHLVNDILDFAKLESKGFTLNRDIFSLPRLLGEAESELKRLCATQPVNVRVEIAENVPSSACGDEIRVRQILNNLCSNAAKFTPSGHIRLSLSATQEPRGLLCRLEVTDSGIGIPANRLEAVFAPFEQADNSVSRNYGGTGLGLPISRRLCRLMGGDLTVDSHLGLGSVFTATFVLETAAEALNDMHAALDAPAAPPPHPAPEARRRRILLAEDYINNARLIRSYLSNSPYDLAIVEDGQKCLDQWLSDKGGFDLILMDISMPVLSGDQALLKLRDAGCQLPILALTANALVDDLDKLRRLGFDDCLVKPISKPDLLAKLAQCLPLMAVTD